MTRIIMKVVANIVLLCFFLGVKLSAQQCVEKPGDNKLPDGVFRNYIGLNEGLRWSPELIKLSADIGIKILRKDLSWNHIEKRKGVYTWDEYDKYLEECEKYKIKVLFILGKTNRVYDSTMTIPIPGNCLWKPYSDYVKECVLRYRDRDVIWELWNEPNVPHMWGDMTPHMWIQHSLDIMKLIRSVDPDAAIAGPANGFGIREDDDNWCFQVLKLLDRYDLRSEYMANLNIWTGHHYTPQAPDNLVIDGKEFYQLQRMILDSHGAQGIPYSTGERGFTANPIPTQRYAYVGSTQRQVAYYVRQCLWGIYNEPKAFIINYVNYDIYKSGKDIVGKEAGIGLKNMLDLLGDYFFRERIATPDSFIVILRFEKDGMNRYVIWDRSNTSKNVPFPLPCNKIRLVDMMGKELQNQWTKDNQIEIGEFPVYIIPE